MGRSKIARILAVPALLALASCAGLDRSDRGLLQPQTVTGPCQVKKFFLVNLITMPTDMTVTNAGQACQFTLINPDQQIVSDAALITQPPAHGRAAAGLIELGRYAIVSYIPEPGYSGADEFEVTVQPRARMVRVAVTVQPPTAPPHGP